MQTVNSTGDTPGTIPKENNGSDFSHWPGNLTHPPGKTPKLEVQGEDFASEIHI